VDGELNHSRVVRLPAGIDLDNAAQVRATLAQALTGGVTVLVADMTATTWCTLEGLQVLLHSRAAADAVAVQLRLAGVQPAVRRLLERTGTIGLLSLYPSLPAALDCRPATPARKDGALPSMQ
jgi:anti-sigma B factor antagonist